MTAVLFNNENNDVKTHTHNQTVRLSVAT